MRMLAAIAIGFYCALMMGGQAQSQTQVVTTITAEQVVSVLQSAGYRATVVTQTDGPKYVKVGMSGINAFVLLGTCTNDNCATVEFYVLWAKSPLYTLDYVNAWNYNTLFTKLSLDSDSDLKLTHGVNLDGGITLDNIKQNALMFDATIGALNSFTGK
jgi:hypothetical protein